MSENIHFFNYRDFLKSVIDRTLDTDQAGDRRGDHFIHIMSYYSHYSIINPIVNFYCSALKYFNNKTFVFYLIAEEIRELEQKLRICRIERNALI